jgi:carbon monoxide dehydrogenase subunit G
MTLMIRQFAQIGIAVATLVSAAPQSAFAHGSTRQKITESIEIAAPPAKVWSVLASFHDMSWLPGVENTTGEGDNTPDVAKRLLTLKGGATVEESLYKYDAAEMTYSYRIEKVDVKVLPVTNYSSTITVVPEGDKTKVEWRGAFYRGWPNNDPPPELNDDAAINAVSALYKSGLNNLKAQIEATH